MIQNLALLRGFLPTPPPASTRSPDRLPNRRNRPPPARPALRQTRCPGAPFAVLDGPAFSYPAPLPLSRTPDLEGFATNRALRPQPDALGPAPVLDGFASNLALPPGGRSPDRDGLDLNRRPPGPPRPLKPSLGSRRRLSSGKPAFRFPHFLILPMPCRPSRHSGGQAALYY